MQKAQEPLQLLVMRFPKADHDGHDQIVLFSRRPRPALKVRLLHGILRDRIFPCLARMRADPDRVDLLDRVVVGVGEHRAIL